MRNPFPKFLDPKLEQEARETEVLTVDEIRFQADMRRASGGIWQPTVRPCPTEDIKVTEPTEPTEPTRLQTSCRRTVQLIKIMIKPWKVWNLADRIEELEEQNADKAQTIRDMIDDIEAVSEQRDIISRLTRKSFLKKDDDLNAF